MKKHTKPIPRQRYIARAVRDFYPDLRNVKHNDPNLQAAVKLGKRCHEPLLNSESTCEINVGVKRKGEKTTVPVDEGQELFDCDSEELNHEPLLESDDSDQDDEENGDPANEGEQSQTENQQTTTVAPVLLASIVKDNPELEKDAIFLDNLGTLLSTSDTSDKFVPFMNNFKRNYIAARRAIKKRILCSKEKVVACEEGDPSDVEDDIDNFANLFDNVFA